jgi:3'-5' exoribonuclease
MEAAASRLPTPPQPDQAEFRPKVVRPRIEDLRSGQRFEGRYACVRRDRLVSRNGSTYLALELRDATGSVPARLFRDADRLGMRFQRGDAVAVRGKAERFQGELAVTVDDIRRLDPQQYDPAEFLPTAYRAIEELEGFLEHLVGEIYDEPLADAVRRAVFAEPVWSEFRRAPCSRAGHHAYLGGLIEHTVSVGTLVGETCQLHPRLDSDLLMAAAIVHDVGKVREFTYAAEIGISEEGRQLGHLAIGAEIVWSAAADLAPERRLALLGCLLQHHGPDSGPGRTAQSGRFGSPEALALYRLNALDASVKGALEQGL